MFSPGDVVSFYSDVAGKRKYHICISLKKKYLFVNSQKKKTYKGDLIFDNSDFPFLPKTENGLSIVSCTRILSVSDAKLKKSSAKIEGSVSVDVLMKILRFVESSPAISQVDKEEITDGLGDWI